LFLKLYTANCPNDCRGRQLEDFFFFFVYFDLVIGYICYRSSAIPCRAM